MRIAIYHPWIYLKGGAERTILELVRHSRHRWTVVTNHFEPYSTFPEFRQLEVIELATVSVKRSLYEVAHAALTLLIQRFDWHQFDALMISSEGLGNLITFHPSLPPVFCYCHTPLKIAHDPITRQQFFAQQRAWNLRAGIRVFTWIDRLAWRRYQHIFCNSRETYQRLLQSHLAPPDKMEVLHPGVDTERLQPTWHSEPYFLLPGRIMWTKNIELGIEAFQRFKRQRPATDPFRLVIAGMLDQKSKPYCKELMRRTRRDAQIEFVISPDDQAMHQLYQNAWGVLNTSLNEDWGLTIIEGMAFGKPVIAVNQGGPTESILHEETGFLCEPEAQSFAERMEHLASDPGRALHMGKLGRQRAAQYDWHAFAQRIDEYIDELCADPTAVDPSARDQTLGATPPSHSYPGSQGQAL